MGDCTFRMLCGYICMTGFAMTDGFFEMSDSLSRMWILSCHSRMLECFFSVLDKSVSMTLFPMCHRFLGMLQGFSCMLVSSSKGKPAEERDANKCGNRRYDQCSTMDVHAHRSLLSG